MDIVCIPDFLHLLPLLGQSFMHWLQGCQHCRRRRHKWKEWKILILLAFIRFVFITSCLLTSLWNDTDVLLDLLALGRQCNCRRSQLGVDVVRYAWNRSSKVRGAVQLTGRQLQCSKWSCVNQHFPKARLLATIHKLTDDLLANLAHRWRITPSA